MKIIPLSEGSFTVDKTKVFVPFDKEADDLKMRPAGSLLVEIQPFAIVTKKDILLLDTGLGFYSPDGTMQLHRNLLNNGIDPSSVTKILLSHLHKDHAGGIENKSNSAHPVLSFPNAVYYVNRKELEFANKKENSSYIPSDFSLLTNSAQVILLNDTGTIDNYIHYEMSGAHCPYHTVFWIKEGNEIFFYGGDVAPQLQQMKNKFVAKYDFDGRKSMELRNQWWHEGHQQHWAFLFYHDIKTPTILL
jgi:glyoxylase-like metal-dependent hydrolase (beta-lactamase superfamily II)